MPTVHVDLQEGFSGDRVVVHIGAQRREHEAATTRAMLGFADTSSADVPAGHTAVQVDVVSRGISDTLELEVDGDVYVGISIAGDTLAPIISAEPFTYL